MELCKNKQILGRCHSCYIVILHGGWYTYGLQRRIHESKEDKWCHRPVSMQIEWNTLMERIYDDGICQNANRKTTDVLYRLWYAFSFFVFVFVFSFPCQKFNKNYIWKKKRKMMDFCRRALLENFHSISTCNDQSTVTAEESLMSDTIE